MTNIRPDLILRSNEAVHLCEAERPSTGKLYGTKRRAAWQHPGGIIACGPALTVCHVATIAKGISRTMVATITGTSLEGYLYDQ